MTRFLISLAEVVELVCLLLRMRRQEISWEKALASTIRDLAQAVKELFSVDNEIKIISNRHG